MPNTSLYLDYLESLNPKKQLETPLIDKTLEIIAAAAVCKKCLKQVKR